MQVGSSAHGVSTTYSPRWLNVLLAIVMIAVIAAMVALLVLAGALMTSSSGAENLSPRAASAILHDDTSNVSPKAASVILNEDAAKVSPRAASVILNEDAGD